MDKPPVRVQTVLAGLVWVSVLGLHCWVPIKLLNVKANYINMSLSTHVNIRLEIRTCLALVLYSLQRLKSQKKCVPPTLCDPGEVRGLVL